MDSKEGIPQQGAGSSRQYFQSPPPIKIEKFSSEHKNPQANLTV
jgi:hypothetical protein